MSKSICAHQISEINVGNPVKYIGTILLYCFWCAFVSAQQLNEAIEPLIEGDNVISLSQDNTLDNWQVPSNLWSIKNGIIIGDTKGEKLDASQWLYTKQSFKDFEFTCELKLSGDERRNTGIYYRVKTFLFTNARGTKSYMAPSGYEFDAAFYQDNGINNKRNDRGALADWYARRSLRILADQSLINKVFKTDQWNRMTIRALANRLEYWINGIKVMNYVDHDPQASREGLIGFQLHNGSAMKVEFRYIAVQRL
ncbi:DUF1080 domain-containing protein [Shewanella sp. 10N.7]|uniref:3-keto-disaccharide hydrolase n=1 Tax=Shewanella sp. 10N.7 TaxID=2885093 RepID=UPI001E626CF7|nr:DUF1080 domain-containing protein [Shewanella sp. 10N.7]MCC4831817.1 DUF1080 domain-containing protein [Shewanella sp. 10N.7]